MNELELLSGLTDRMSKLFDGYSVIVNRGDVDYASEVKVYAQYMPQPEGITWSDSKTGLQGYVEDDYEKNFPCVIVKLGERSDYQSHNRENSIVNVKILTGIYDPGQNCQGYREVINMMVKIRDELYRDREINKRNRLLLPLKSHLVEADTWPVYFGEISMQYEVPMKVMSPEYIYGRGHNDGGLYRNGIVEARRV